MRRLNNLSVLGWNRAKAAAGGGGLVPAGDELRFAQDPGTMSSSGYELKANIWDMQTTRFLTKFAMRSDSLAVTNTIDAMLWVARLDTGLFTVAEQIFLGQEFPLVDGYSEDFVLASPILLEAGKRYAIGFLRTDGKATAMRIGADVTPNTDPDRHFVAAPGNQVVRGDVSLTVGIGQDVSYTSSSGLWAIAMTTEAAA